ncbi:hypothetical protein F9K50_06235 [bacterium]|nr:MAG: hypothetical protein F9K50_06235 [bacterium]
MELLSSASRARLDAAARAEIQSLQQETDPALAAEAWLAFAGRQERAGRLETAAEIYTAVAGAQQVEPLRSNAQARLEAILGGGPFGARFEFLARHFAAQAADPAMLAVNGEIAVRFARARLGATEVAIDAPGDARLLARAAASALPDVALVVSRDPEPAFAWAEAVERLRESWPIPYLLPGAAALRVDATGPRP